MLTQDSHKILPKIIRSNKVLQSNTDPYLYIKDKLCTSFTEVNPKGHEEQRILTAKQVSKLTPEDKHLK